MARSFPRFGAQSAGGRCASAAATTLPASVVSLVLFGLGWGAGFAHAEPELSPIEDRDYAIDLYQGTVLGSVRIVGMGGAHVALAEGSAGMIANPAGAAVRRGTATDVWDWDWHIDWLNPELGSDFDNNGFPTDGELPTAPLLTMGIVIQDHYWAIGANVDFNRREVKSGQIAPEAVEPSLLVGRVVLARVIETFTVGAGIRVGQFQLSSVNPDFTLFKIEGVALEAGMVWQPRDRDLRVGAVVYTPVAGTKVKAEACDPADCVGYILPNEVQLPWRLAAGVAWRRAESRWNRPVQTRWRDERYVLVSADLVIDGPAEDGYGIEAFIDKKMLQRSGQRASVSPRLGVEYEWVPGRFRVRAGSYYEPSRFDGVSGRPHVTAGFDLRLLGFRFYDEHYRVRLSITGDVADRYGNTGASLGLWH